MLRAFVLVCLLFVSPIPAKSVVADPPANATYSTWVYYTDDQNNQYSLVGANVSFFLCTNNNALVASYYGTTAEDGTCYFSGVIPPNFVGYYITVVDYTGYSTGGAWAPLNTDSPPSDINDNIIMVSLGSSE